MELFEVTIALLLVGALLAALSRRVGVPYPAFLALAGAGLALVPGTPAIVMSPELVLTLFVAPSLLDAAFDASPRDLRANWRSLVRTAVIAVLVTVAAVAIVARWLRPDMPWAVAIVLGAIVAPPDASAATAVLRALRPPHRIMVILEGESLFNDATALLIYRVALGVAVGRWAGWSEAPFLFLSLVGGTALGLALGKVFPYLVAPVRDGPTAVIIQFVGAFAIWIIAVRLELSAILTVLFFAMTVARSAPQRMNAYLRIQSYAVWDVAIFVLNVLAFIGTGLQLRPILESLGGVDWRDFALFGTAILAACVASRMAYVMSYGAIARRWGRFPAPAAPPTVATGLVIGWCGMRGVVTLATALALPEDFPFRGLILFAAFIVVLGTLVIQGVTLRPLMRGLRLPEDDVVAREVEIARSRAAEAAVEALDREGGEAAAVIRRGYERRRSGEAASVDPAPLHDQRILALRAERQAILALRHAGVIGDDAFHVVEQELDWAEMYVGLRGANA